MALRITGGNLRGRQLRAPGGLVRPTQDRVRAALFSMLGAMVDGARVLDLFAGAGTLGLESYSRGAGYVVWVELRRRVWLMLRENVRLLCGVEPACAVMRDARPVNLACVCADARRFLRDMAAGHFAAGFDLVFADPPYAETAGYVKNLLPMLLQGAILSSGACLALEQSVALIPAECDGWNLWRARDYGETRICLYRRVDDDEKRGGLAQSGNISRDV